jgi:drug/metabolite transporter (DMT)-like permease
MPHALTYRQGVVLIVAAGILWSLMGLLIRLIGDVGTWQVLFYRSVGMIPVLFAAIAIRSGGHPFRAIRATGLPGIISGASLIGAFAGAIFAIQSTTVANAVFLFSATPFLSALLGLVILREPVRLHTWIAIAIAMAGIFLMVRDGIAIGAGLGNAAALLSSLCFAVFTVLTRWGDMPDQMPAILIGAVLSSATAAAMIVAGGVGFAVPLPGMLIAMAMGAVILGLGLSIFALGGRVVPAAEMSLLALLEVLLAPVWVWLFLGETTGSAILTGGAVVLAALVFNTLAAPRARAGSRGG